MHADHTFDVYGNDLELMRKSRRETLEVDRNILGEDDDRAGLQTATRGGDMPGQACWMAEIEGRIGRAKPQRLSQKILKRYQVIFRQKRKMNIDSMDLLVKLQHVLFAG